MLFYINQFTFSTWLDDKDNPVVRQLSVLSEALTGLDIAHSEKLQVFFKWTDIDAVI